MSAEPVVDAALAAEHGLAADEYERLLGILGRAPTYTELGITSALWSEHCSYKSSRVYLREFPTEGERVVQGPGENAGVVDVGHGWLAVFKMESHNHPSFIEPYQGAATGVGGILRDVFTMGARPIACLDSLRFGAIDAPRMRYLVDGVVRGIGDYGNCVGIPTVGGETGFHPSYNQNILVNAFALGLAREDGLFLARASGEGNPILYAAAGRAGTASTAPPWPRVLRGRQRGQAADGPGRRPVYREDPARSLPRGDAHRRNRGHPGHGRRGPDQLGLRDGGREGTGVEMDLSLVPLREEGLTPYEMMLSESQERMVLVAERGREEEGRAGLRALGPGGGSDRCASPRAAALSSPSRASWSRTCRWLRSRIRRRCTGVRWRCRTISPVSRNRLKCQRPRIRARPWRGSWVRSSCARRSGSGASTTTRCAVTR